MRILASLREVFSTHAVSFGFQLNSRMQRVAALAAVALLALGALYVYNRKRPQLSLQPPGPPRVEPKVPTTPAQVPMPKFGAPVAEETADELAKYLLSQKCEELAGDTRWGHSIRGCPKTFADDFDHVEAIMEWTQSTRMDRAGFYLGLQTAYKDEHVAFNLAKLIVKEQKEPIIAFAKSFYASRNLVAKCTSTGLTVADNKSGPELHDYIYLTFSMQFSSERGTPLTVVVGRTLKFPLVGLRQAGYNGEGITVTHQIKTLKDPLLKNAPIQWTPCVLKLYGRTVTEEILAWINKYKNSSLSYEEAKKRNTAGIWLNGLPLIGSEHSEKDLYQALDAHFNPQTTLRIARLICKNIYNFLENLAESRWPKSWGFEYVQLFKEENALHLCLNLTTSRDEDKPVQLIRCTIHVPRRGDDYVWGKIQVESSISSEIISLDAAREYLTHEKAPQPAVQVISWTQCETPKDTSEVLQKRLKSLDLIEQMPLNDIFVPACYARGLTEVSFLRLNGKVLNLWLTGASAKDSYIALAEFKWGGKIGAEFLGRVLEEDFYHDLKNHAEVCCRSQGLLTFSKKRDADIRIVGRNIELTLYQFFDGVSSDSEYQFLVARRVIRFAIPEGKSAPEMENFQLEDFISPLFSSLEKAQEFLQQHLLPPPTAWKKCELPPRALTSFPNFLKPKAEKALIDILQKITSLRLNGKNLIQKTEGVSAPEVNLAYQALRQLSWDRDLNGACLVGVMKTEFYEELSGHAHAFYNAQMAQALPAETGREVDLRVEGRNIELSLTQIFTKGGSKPHESHCLAVRRLIRFTLIENGGVPTAQGLSIEDSLSPEFSSLEKAQEFLQQHLLPSLKDTA